MDIFMQLEKENGDLFINPSKRNQSSIARPSKRLHMKTHSSDTAKVQSLRRPLGNVNQQMQDRYTSTKVKQRNDQVHPKNKTTYPDIETFIPYNPLAFETSDVPEEHRLSNRRLAGVRLFISTDAKRFEALTDPILSPMENELINYDAWETLSPVFEDFAIALPPVCDF
ncbi:putative pituitary tumor-transforming gene 3 protein [Leptodactylus fuscus]|uniref:putative pituitary tumor-transforming gene 3 protein n=1 Tax=Leptodactylus fuscus TaxID=238119 RepID=UPI003F4F217D